MDANIILAGWARARDSHRQTFATAPVAPIPACVADVSSDSDPDANTVTRSAAVKHWNRELLRSVLDEPCTSSSESEAAPAEAESDSDSSCSDEDSSSLLQAEPLASTSTQSTLSSVGDGDVDSEGSSDAESNSDSGDDASDDEGSGHDSENDAIPLVEVKGEGTDCDAKPPVRAPKRLDKEAQLTQLHRTRQQRRRLMVQHPMRNKTWRHGETCLIAWTCYHHRVHSVKIQVRPCACACVRASL